MTANARAIDWVEQGRVPDSLIRAGIRRLLRARLAQLHANDAQRSAELTEAFIASLRVAELAPVPAKANEQHYEVPAEFFAAVLGQHRKYSSCYYESPHQSLDEAEAAALRITCERAQLTDGQEVLELGCGWGSLSLWMAERYPHSHITGVSNSHSQRSYIEQQARSRGLDNLKIITCDMNQFDAGRQFDRIVSVEMFEHMRNWPALFARVADWLCVDGRFFMHVFCHRSVPYAFDDEQADDWMSRHFFSGGMMPSDDLPSRFQDHLQLLSRWRWDGTHYERTANHWLANMDANRIAIWPILEATYGASEAPRWWMRWRLFFMACAELWGYADGQEWWVSHYLFSKRATYGNATTGDATNGDAT
jgi:cyclopropane-fatty-acyl-phospholipid synthase